MKLRILIVMGIGMATLLGHAADQDKPKDNPAFKNQKEKISYSLGVNYGNTWKRQEVDIDIEMMNKGIRDVLAGKGTLLTEQEIRETLNAYGAELRAKSEEKRKALGEKNKKESEAFLAENKKKPGVITTTNGLQYKVIKEGTGPIPKSTDEVTVNYRGTLIDGTEFDNSQKFSRRVTGVVKGWQDALQMMKVGSQWQLFIPSDLAYGQFGKGTNIGPNVALIFDLELLSTKPATNAPAQSFTAPGNTLTAPKVNQPAVTSDIIKVPSAEELKKGAKIEVIKADTLEKKGEIEPVTKPEKK
ncbi:MAG TPA: FKBP-type peptidyl-prolyl cis-trans isomerase [Candidatus Eisenbacteria bacterium]|nr:FKBP-type peptidyl-prolyl cis-trans isomerase [Candidatus Eisenbacteria bacterium]